MKDAFEQLMRESDKEETVPESIAKYAAALVAGTHEITSLTIQPKLTWVGLTDEDITKIDQGLYPTWKDEVQAIEARLKELNNG